MTFSLTILGSSAALPTSQRFPTAHVLQVDERFFVIDCGEGTQIQLRRFKVKMSQIKAIFISHLHGDHVFGLPGLLSSLSALDRTEPIEIYGPPLLDEWLTNQLKYFTPLNFPIHFRILASKEPELIYENKQITVSCFPLKHRIPTWGYLFREKEKLLNIRKDMIEFYQIPLRDILAIKSGADYQLPDGQIIANEKLTHPPMKPRSFAYCSDTMYMDHLSEVVRGVDLLYHEATFGNDAKDRAKETFHSTAEEAAKVAKAAEVEKLVIGHFSARYKNINPLLEEARQVFAHTEAAEDGRIFEVIRQRKK